MMRDSLVGVHTCTAQHFHLLRLNLDCSDLVAPRCDGEMVYLLMLAVRSALRMPLPSQHCRHLATHYSPPPPRMVEEQWMPCILLVSQMAPWYGGSHHGGREPWNDEQMFVCQWYSNVHRTMMILVSLPYKNSARHGYLQVIRRCCDFLKDQFWQPSCTCCEILGIHCLQKRNPTPDLAC